MTSSMDYMLNKNKLVLQENLDLQNIKNEIKNIYLSIQKKNEIPENLLKYFQKTVQENQSKTLIINEINDILLNVLDNIQQFPKFINKEFNELKVIFENPNNPIIKEIPEDIQLALDDLKKIIDSSILKINNDVSTIKINIDILKKRNSNFQNSISEINSDIKSIQVDLNNLKNIRNRVNQLTILINTATTNIKITNDSLNKTKNDVTLLQNSVSDILVNINNLFETIISNSQSINEINNEIDNIKKNISSTNNTINNNINVNINNIRNDLTNTKNEISNNITSNINNLRTDLNNNVTTLTNTIALTQNDINDLRDNLVNTSNDVSIIYTQANKNNIRTIYFKNAEIDNIVAQDFTLLSDKRLKKNIQNIQYPNKILELNAKNYKWIDSNKNDTGFIAQDVQELFPEMVNEDKNGILSVNYIKFVPLIVEVIKKQNQEILFLKIGFVLLFIILIGIIIYIKNI